ncbi:MAG: nuclear transport factor 2 family protein [Chloroflexota bacterium]|nr:nuclear transport factor 2 family protein [Chloroflexota bacterium]
MSAKEQTLVTIKLFNEAFNRHDVEAVMKLMTDDVWRSPYTSALQPTPRDDGAVSRQLNGTVQSTA